MSDLRYPVAFLRMCGNWVRWCIKFRTVCPWSVRLISPEPPWVGEAPPEVLRWAREAIARYETGINA